MVPGKETAEEQLLHMIEGPAGSRQGARQGSRGRALDWLVGGLRGLREFLRRLVVPSRPRKDRGDPFLWRLQLVNRAFWGLLLGLGGYLALDLIVFQPAPPTLPAPPRTVAGAGALERPPVGRAFRPLEEYQQAMRLRNPFRLASARVVEERAVDVGQTAETTLNQMISSLTVVGINRGVVPEALIESTETNRTHVVKVGDTLSGVRIEAIDHNGVFVSYDGETTYLP